MGLPTGRIPLQLKLSIIALSVAQGSSAERAAVRAPFTGKVASVSYVPNTAIVGADTNTRALILANGANDVASVQFNAGTDAPQYEETALALSGTAENLNVTEGDILVFKSNKVGTGIADPGGIVVVELVRD